MKNMNKEFVKKEKVEETTTYSIGNMKVYRLEEQYQLKN